MRSSIARVRISDSGSLDLDGGRESREVDGFESSFRNRTYWIS